MKDWLKLVGLGGAIGGAGCLWLLLIAAINVLVWGGVIYAACWVLQSFGVI